MLAAISHPDLNTVALIVGALIAVVFLPRFFRASAAKAREEQMNATIKAYKDRVEALEPQVESLADEVKSCRDTAAIWEARYHEQAKYAAPEALAAVLSEMRATRTLIHTSMEGFSELVMEHSRLVARALDKLDPKP